MPSAHRIAIKKLIETIDKRIAADEADGERDNLVNEIGNLMVRRKELLDALAGESSAE